MQIINIVVFGLVGLASAIPTPLVDRSAATIVTHIAAVSKQLTTFDNDINNFDGNFFDAISLLSAYATLRNDVTDATTDVTSTGALGATDSATIYEDVDALTTQIVSALTDARAKASVVESSGYSSYVLSALQTLKTDAASFYTALETYIYSTYTSKVETLAGTVSSAFDTTIAIY